LVIFSAAGHCWDGHGNLSASCRRFQRTSTPRAADLRGRQRR
jgi:hypothetical protein